MLEAILGIFLLYIFPIFYQARTRFKNDKLTITSSIISSFAVITGGYAIFIFYFYITHLLFEYLLSLEFNRFINFILGACLVIGGVLILMFTIIKVLGFVDKKLSWKK